MDGHNASFKKNVKVNRQKESSYPRNTIPSFKSNTIQNNNFSQKSTQVKVSNGKINNLSKIQKDQHQHHDDYIQLFDCFQQNQDEDSDYQFSEQIMEKNVKKESRATREEGKLIHLSIFDWMVKISAILKLRKQTVYRSIIMLKKFMFFQQKLPSSKVTLSNANLYAFASILISNKLDNIDGNFLPKIHRLSEGQIGTFSEKERILQCEIYIMRTLKFDINENILIIQTLIDIIHIWNQIIRNTALSTYTFSPYDRIISFVGKQESQKTQQDGDGSGHLLEVFMYLMDFVMMRKLVEIRIKDMKNLQDPIFFKKIIVNVLYHLIHFLINQSKRDLKMVELKAFKNVFSLLANKLQFPKSELSTLFRKSHLLNKQLRTLFSNQSSAKLQSLHKIATHHNTIKRQYCVCNLSVLSKKFLDLQQLLKKQRQYEHQIIYQPQTQQQPKDEQYQTDLLIKQPAKKQEIDDAKLPSGYCKKCLKDEKLISSIINKQFYVPIYFKDRH